ncbi:MAG TPA: hypothetical protein VGH27_08375 [Streptosporangiaceae bacterium]|jgi:hypothetical protein
MTNFDDQLLSDLMTKHGAQLRDLPQPGSEPAAGPRRSRLRVTRRPAWLATGVAGVAAAATAAALTLGGAAPAYAVSTGPNGTVNVSISQSSGISGANATLQRLHVRVRVVPVRTGCPAMSSLPHPKLTHHPALTLSVGGAKGGGHRSISLKVSGPGIPAGATMLLAFTTQGGTNLGAGGWITGPIPGCVSLPTPPAGQSNSVPAP